MTYSCERAEPLMNREFDLTRIDRPPEPALMCRLE